MRRYLFSLNNTFAITIPILFFLSFIIIQQQTFAVENIQNATIVSDAKNPSLFEFFENIKNGTENPIVSNNATESSTDYNFIAAGDWTAMKKQKRQ